MLLQFSISIGHQITSILTSPLKGEKTALSFIRKLVLVCACASLLLPVVMQVNRDARAEGPINITFEFSPAKASYEPGENITVNFTVVNTVLPGGNKEKVTNITAHFGWMAPSTFARTDVSGSSLWLASGEVGAYSLNIAVPQNATPQTYSYFFIINYMVETQWGPITYSWGSDLTYHDFVVAEATAANPNGTPDYLPFVAIVALVLAVVAIGAAVYWRSGRQAGTAAVAPAPPAPATEANSPPAVESYPVIMASPGEGFPVEKGFIYLVKEKRPSISFAMFKEATDHGALGMLVVREHPNRLKQMHEFSAKKILWLTRRVGVDHIDPTELSLLNLEITKFVEGTPKSVVLLEGLEYIITQNDFETVLRFVNHLHDFVLAHDCAVIVIIDPRVLSTRELALLERSARIVEPSSSVLVRSESTLDEQPA